MKKMTEAQAQSLDHLRQYLGLDENGSPPPLDPDLRPYLHDGKNFPFAVLKHPLVFAVPYHDMENGRLNKMLAHKRKALVEAEDNEDWNSYMYLHERPYRLDALMEIASLVSDEEWWTLVASAWTDSENIHQNMIQWREIFTDREGSLAMMDEEEREMFDRLPDVITIYRGTNAPHGSPMGMSWTLDYEMAEWFANRLKEIDGKGTPRVYRGSVKKENVIALLLGRNEKEIIVLPENVTLIQTIWEG